MNVLFFLYIFFVCLYSMWEFNHIHCFSTYTFVISKTNPFSAESIFFPLQVCRFSNKKMYTWIIKWSSQVIFSLFMRIFSHVASVFRHKWFLHMVHSFSHLIFTWFLYTHVIFAKTLFSHVIHSRYIFIPRTQFYLLHIVHIMSLEVMYITLKCTFTHSATWSHITYKITCDVIFPEGPMEAEICRAMVKTTGHKFPTTLLTPV